MRASRRRRDLLNCRRLLLLLRLHLRLLLRLLLLLLLLSGRRREPLPRDERSRRRCGATGVSDGHLGLPRHAPLCCIVSAPARDAQESRDRSFGPGRDGGAPGRGREAPGVLGVGTREVPVVTLFFFCFVDSSEVGGEKSSLSYRIPSFACLPVVPGLPGPWHRLFPSAGLAPLFQERPGRSL